jgi:hypothetical protein
VSGESRVCAFVRVCVYVCVNVIYVCMCVNARRCSLITVMSHLSVCVFAAYTTPSLSCDGGATPQ